MKDEDVALFLCFKYVVLGVVFLVIAFIGSCQMTNYRIQKAIDSGVPPLQARCAMEAELTTVEALLCDREYRGEEPGNE